MPAGWHLEASKISCHSVEELWCEEAEEREESEEEEKEEARQAEEKRELRPTLVGKETLVVAGIVLETKDRLESESAWKFEIASLEEAKRGSKQKREEIEFNLILWMRVFVSKS